MSTLYEDITGPNGTRMPSVIPPSPQFSSDPAVNKMAGQMYKTMNQMQWGMQNNAYIAPYPAAPQPGMMPSAPYSVQPVWNQMAQNMTNAAQMSMTPQARQQGGGLQPLKAPTKQQAMDFSNAEGVADYIAIIVCNWLMYIAGKFVAPEPDLPGMDETPEQQPGMPYGQPGMYQQPGMQPGMQYGQPLVDPRRMGGLVNSNIVMPVNYRNQMDQHFRAVGAALQDPRVPMEAKQQLFMQMAGAVQPYTMNQMPMPQPQAYQNPGQMQQWMQGAGYAINNNPAMMNGQTIRQANQAIQPVSGQATRMSDLAREEMAKELGFEVMERDDFVSPEEAAQTPTANDDLIDLNEEPEVIPGDPNLQPREIPLTNEAQPQGNDDLIDLNEEPEVIPGDPNLKPKDIPLTNEAEPAGPEQMDIEQAQKENPSVIRAEGGDEVVSEDAQQRMQEEQKEQIDPEKEAPAEEKEDAQAEEEAALDDDDEFMKNYAKSLNEELEREERQRQEEDIVIEQYFNDDAKENIDELENSLDGKSMKDFSDRLDDDIEDDLEKEDKQGEKQKEEKEIDEDLKSLQDEIDNEGKPMDEKSLQEEYDKLDRESQKEHDEMMKSMPKQPEIKLEGMEEQQKINQFFMDYADSVNGRQNGRSQSVQGKEQTAGKAPVQQEKAMSEIDRVRQNREQQRLREAEKQKKVIAGMKAMQQQQEKLLRDTQKSRERIQNDPKMKKAFEEWKKNQNKQAADAKQKSMQDQNRQGGPVKKPGDQ